VSHDYDVGAISLSVPPASAVIQSYRPAVLVKNNGIHDALAVGSLRIYSPAGLLIFTTEIYSGTIAPGETEPAQAVDYWTPPALGLYMFIAYVTCINDQYEPNNSLPPSHVDVTAAPPPPPPPVQAHASQHEDGGQDEVNIDGLHGKTADAQTALAHKLTHQAAGSDQLDVSGLPGILAQGQPIADHHTSHELGGGDQLWVGGLHGELTDNQPAKVHDNAKHNPNYTTVTDFGNHLADTTDVHEVATNLEHIAHKGEPDGYPELDEYGHVPPPQLAVWTTPPPANDKALLPNNTFGYPFPAAHTATEHDDTVEATANKEQANGYPGLDETTRIARARLAQAPAGAPDSDMAPRYDGDWGRTKPSYHHNSHETGGDDEISIAGLSGKAADAQDPTGHHVSHEPGGSDPISIAYDVPWSNANQFIIYGDSAESTIAQLVAAAKWMNQGFGSVLRAWGILHAENSPSGYLTIRMKRNATVIYETHIDVDPDFDRYFSLTAIYHATSSSVLQAHLAIILEDSTGVHQSYSHLRNSNDSSFSAEISDFTISAIFTAASHNTYLLRSGYACHGTGPVA
jgi:hypothetical protein